MEGSPFPPFHNMLQPDFPGAHPDFGPQGAGPSLDALVPRGRRTSKAARGQAPFVHWSIDDLDEQARRFVEDCRLVEGQSPYTLGSYRVAYSNFRAFLLQRAGVGHPLGHFLFGIEEWTAWNRRKGMKPVTLNTYWRRLRSFFAHLERRHGIPSPFRGLRQPALPARVPKALAPDECRRILDAAANYPWETAFERTRAVAIIGMALFAGLRRSEVLKLQFLDVDVQLGTVRVNGGKGRGGGKDRVVPMAPDLRAAVGAYLRERRLHGIVSPEFFSSRKAGGGLSLSTFRRIVARVQRAAGSRASFHQFRHSFVTQLLRSGVALHTAGALAGHSQITTTAGYLRVFDEDKVDAVRALRF